MLQSRVTLLLVGAYCNSASDSFNGLHGVLIALNHLQQDALDWIELGGVDERVGADVEKCNEEVRVVGIFKKCKVCIEIQKKVTDIRGHPSDGKECTDKDHCLDDVGLNLI